MDVLVINGPNINMLGVREPSIYGEKSYNDLLKYIEEEAEKLDIEVEFFQSNVEGFIVDRIQKAYFDSFDGIVINPGAYTHTSIAIGDAIKATGIPAVEVHLSDINKREEYRKISFVKDACKGQIMGKGFEGYKEALELLKK